MTSVEPIRDEAKVIEIQRMLRKQAEKSERGKRAYLLFICGVYLGLRISDLLKLRVGDLRGDKITMREKKTKKRTELPVANIIRRAARELLSEEDDDTLVFRSPQKVRSDRAIARKTAYNDINAVARMVGVKGPIGCHTMRKTFGYHQYKMDGDIAFLQEWFNHSSPAITLRYIGIDQDRRRKKVNRMEQYLRERGE